MKKKIIQEKQEKHRGYTFETKSIDRDLFTVEGVFSTQEIDRHGEIVMQNGWKLDAYRANPVVLWAHQSNELPIAKMLEIKVDESNQLVGKMQFAVNEYPFAKTVFDMIAGGFQKAFSAGFMNEVFQIDQANDTIILNENELFEVSCVPIPANKLALVKAKGINTDLYEKELAEAGYVKQAQFEIKEAEVDEEKALNVLSNSNKETIRKAIQALTALVGDSEADTQGGQKVDDTVHSQKKETTVSKKIAVNTFNRAVKSLLKVRSAVRK